MIAAILREAAALMRSRADAADWIRAVADLLDNTAGHVEYTGDTEKSEDVRDALIIARAYLGRST